MSLQNCRVVASGVDPEAYHRTSEKRGTPTYPVSKSMLGDFAACPARWIRGYTRPETKALTNGSLWDGLLLTPEKFGEKYIECPSQYPGANGEMKPWTFQATYCKSWREANKGLEPVKSDDLEDARAAVAAVLENPDLEEMLRGAQKQVMVVGEWQDRATGLVIPVKALLDIVPAKAGPFRKMLLDFKTTRNASMRKWTRDCYDFGYGVQAAFHSDLYVAATGEDRCCFGHIVQENVAPFHVEKRALTCEFITLGRGQYMAALKLYCQCLATNKWPGYDAYIEIDGWQEVSPEAWMINAGDFREFSTATDEPQPAFASETPS